MAGDWIKIEHWTPDKPEVFRIAEILGIDPDAVTGKLIRIWVWADQQTIDGNASVTQMYAKCNAGGVTKKLIDRLASVTGFADSMVAVGWLVEVEAGVRFINFDRHNGETAKKRAQTAKRVKRNRDGVTQMKRECNAESVTESAQTALPEKRREEITNTDVFVIGEKPKRQRKSFEPPTVEQVADYCRERSNGIDAERFVAFYSARGWMAGKVKMRDWQAAVRTWEKNTDGTTGRHYHSTTGQNREAERIGQNIDAIAAFIENEDKRNRTVHIEGVRESDDSPFALEEHGQADGADGREVVYGDEDFPNEDNQHGYRRTLFD